jgi:hypothetical protein
MQYVRGLGLGVYTKPKTHNPGHDPIELGRQMEDAVNELFEGDKQIPGRGKRKARLAER